MQLAQDLRRGLEQRSAVQIQVRGGILESRRIACWIPCRNFGEKLIDRHTVLDGRQEPG